MHKFSSFTFAYHTQILYFSVLSKYSEFLGRFYPLHFENYQLSPFVPTLGLPYSRRYFEKFSFTFAMNYFPARGDFTAKVDAKCAHKFMSAFLMI